MFLGVLSWQVWRSGLYTCDQNSTFHLRLKKTLKGRTRFANELNPEAPYVRCKIVMNSNAKSSTYLITEKGSPLLVSLFLYVPTIMLDSFNNRHISEK